MKTFLLLLCCVIVDAIYVNEGRDSSSKTGLRSGPLQPVTNGKRKVVPKYILQLYKQYSKHGRKINNLHCIFPKIIRTKRAIKLLFNSKSFKSNRNSKWQRDELRMFMTTPKKWITEAGKSYHVKVFDLYSKKLVNVFKFSSRDDGWKTLNISDWRSGKPLTDSRGRIGLKIVVVLGRKKLNINKTAFRKPRNRIPETPKPYFIAFSHASLERDAFKSKEKAGNGRFKKNNLAIPSLKHDLIERGYNLAFQRYKARHSFE